MLNEVILDHSRSKKVKVAKLREKIELKSVSAKNTLRPIFRPHTFNLRLQAFKTIRPFSTFS